MKKAFSLLTVLTLVFLMSVSAFAAEDIAPYGGTTLNGQPINEPVANGEANNELGNIGMAPRLAWSGENVLAIKTGELFLVHGEGANAAVVLPDTRLEPNSEYTFHIYYATADADLDVTEGTLIPAGGPIAPLTKAQVGDAKVRVRATKGGSAIKSTEVKTRSVGSDTTYRVVIETKDTYNTKQTEVDYTISLTGALLTDFETKGGNAVFMVGHGIMSDTEIDNYGEEEDVNVSNLTPIFKKKQIETLVKANKYKAITLIAEDDSWEYTGRMNGMSDTNFYYTHDVIPSIVNKFDQDFKFLIFPAGVTFPTNGEMRIDVSDVSDEWERMYTYLYRNGKLTRVNTSYDSSDDMIVFRTNYLGAFVMTDKEITDVNIIETEKPEPSEPAPKPEPEVSGGVGTGTGNPNTGAPVGLNLLVGLGSISLLTAGSVIVRKRK